MIGVDIVNAFGSVYRHSVLHAVGRRAPALLPYLLAAWEPAGSLLFTQGPNGWTQGRAARGVLQGSPIAEKLFAITFDAAIEGELGAQVQAAAVRGAMECEELMSPSCALRSRRLAYADDLTLWSDSEETIVDDWPMVASRLADAGMEIKPSKCTTMRPHDPTNTAAVIPGIAVDTGMVVLGSAVSEDAAFRLGKQGQRWLDGSPQPATKDPVETRAERALQLAQAATLLGLSGIDDRAVHVAFVILQRLVCPALDYDARSLSNGHVADLACRLHTEVVSSVGRLMKSEIPQHAVEQLALSGDIGGVAMRLPRRHGSIAAARWASLQIALPTAKQYVAVNGMTADWNQADQELQQAVQDLANLGVDVTSGQPVRSPDADDACAQCIPAKEAQERDAMLVRSTGRSRLQGRAGRILDVNALAAAWPTWTSQKQTLIADIAGPSTGLIFTETPRDDREGWLADCHFQVHFLDRLGLPSLAPGHSCAISPSTGPRKGQPCGVQLDVHGRHIGERCKAGGLRTRIHHSYKRRMVRNFQQAGLNADAEVVIPELHREHRGKLQEAIMDIVVSRPGSSSRFLIDVRTVDGQADLGPATQRLAMEEAARKKTRRYGSTVWPFVVELRGTLHPSAMEVLSMLAAESKEVRPDGPPAPVLIRRWLRALETTLAFERTECRRVSLCTH